MGFRVVVTEEDAILNMARSRRGVAVREKLGHTGSKRHQGHPVTSDRIYADDETEFLCAMEHFKRMSGRKFPTWSDALGVLKALGYAKMADAQVKRA